MQLHIHQKDLTEQLPRKLDTLHFRCQHSACVGSGVTVDFNIYLFILEPISELCTMLLNLVSSLKKENLLIVMGSPTEIQRRI